MSTGINESLTNTKKGLTVSWRASCLKMKRRKNKQIFHEGNGSCEEEVEYKKDFVEVSCGEKAWFRNF